MKKILQLVRGAVSTKDLLPVLTHFHIYEGRVQGGNGRIAIDAPCPELKGFDCTVPAERFLKAVDACDGEPKLKLTDGGKLTVSKGKFRATLPLANHAAFPKVTELPALEAHLGGAELPVLLPILRKLYPFISTDRTRPWMCAVFINEGYAWATDNVCMARIPCGFFQDFILPMFVVDELLRIGEEPTSVQADVNSITLHFAEGWWMRAQKLHGEWPNVAALVPEKLSDHSWPSRVLAEAVRKIVPFCPNPEHPIIQIGPEGVGTLEGEMSALVGYDNLPVGRFRAESLLAVLDASTTIDLSSYPKACYWRGEAIDGVLVGTRK